CKSRTGTKTGLRARGPRVLHGRSGTSTGARAAPTKARKPAPRNAWHDSFITVWGPSSQLIRDAPMRFRPGRPGAEDPAPRDGQGPARADVLRAVLVIGVTVSLVVLVMRAFSVTCPPERPCLTLAELEEGVPLPEAIELLDRDGELLAEVAGPLRRALEPEDVPPLLAQAYVAVEDRRFWDHGGVDVRGVFRAAVRNVRAGEVAEGASTIPMQLVRTLWSESLREAGPWRRKVIEAMTAPRLIDALGHERVLTLYLNSIYLGNGIYGVERAAEYYFGTGVDSLDLAEIATLVGMTPGPERFEPRRHPERARARRDVVLHTLEA